MRIDKMEIRPGEKKKFYLEVEGCEYRLPVVVICGGEGAVTLITGGIHNAEYVGIQAAIELSRELEPEDVPGTVIIVPLVNVSGFAHRTMSMVYEDGKNLNREFPGKKNGTVADKICRTVEEKLFSVADAYIDLHCGDGYEELYPYVYYVGPVKEEVREKSLAMAKCAAVDYIVESQTVSGGAYNYASSLGIPSVLIERGCKGLWSREEVEADKADVRRMLEFLYSQSISSRLDDSVENSTKQSGQTKDLSDDSAASGEYEKRKQIIFTEVIYENSPFTGCWYPRMAAGDRIHVGDILGEVKDYFGEILHVCLAKADGVMLYETASLCILEGGPMVAYGCF